MFLKTKNCEDKWLFLPISRQIKTYNCSEVLQILIISIALLSLSMLGMALNILVKKKGKFPAYRVGHNKDMKKLGISCVKHEEIKCQRKRLKDAGCEGCGGGS